MRCKMMLLSLTLALATTLSAQSLAVFGSGTVVERGLTRLLLFDQAKNTPAGELAIDYGRPKWREEYDQAEVFDKATNGKVWRFGRDFWTVLDTNVPLKFGGREVPAGSYYLGLDRSADGSTWSLAFIDPARARARRMDAFQAAQAPVEFLVPTAYQKTESSEATLKLVLTAEKENPRHATLTIRWGPHQLTVPIEVETEG